MYQISRKRVNLSLEEKLWIIRKNKEHEKNSLKQVTQLALDFSVKFKRSITKLCICKTVNKSAEILALATKKRLSQFYTVPTHNSDTLFALTEMSLFWGKEDFAKKIHRFSVIIEPKCRTW